MFKSTQLFIRNIIFGVVDSLVSTVGLLSGIGASGTSRHIIVLTGIIYAIVEAFSMAVGSFLSEQSSEEYEAKGEVANNGPLAAGIVMFASFTLASFIPILPYIVFDLATALWLSIILSIVALAIVGAISAHMIRVSVLKHSIKIVLLGSAAIIIGVIIGKFIKAA